MDAKLIYSYLLSLAACLVVSCTADTSDDETVKRGAGLSFEVSELTRASVTTGLDKFSVYGDMQIKDTRTIIFDKTEVVRNHANGKWNYAGPTQYWFPQHVYSFVAIAPVSAFEAGNGPQYSNSAISFTYTLPDNFKSTHDLLVATHRRMYKDNRGSSSALPVKFGFFHILSRINFNVKSVEVADILRVTKIELKGINRTGTFTVVPAPLLSGSEQTDDYNSSWTGISNKGNLTANILVDIPENESRSLFPDDNALFMIPQPDNKDVITEITYELWDDGEKFEEHTLTAKTPIGGWEPGKVYTYSIAINAITKEIYVTVSVKDWQTPNPTGITVPES